MLKPIALIAAAITLSTCASIRTPERGDGIVRINPASLAADPARWNGRQVEIVGLLIWEFENLGLYQSYGAYCRGAEKAAIYVQWPQWAGVTRKDNRRRVVVRGTFRAQPQGVTIVATGVPGPGSLEPGQVVRWLSKPAKPCPRALP